MKRLLFLVFNISLLIVATFLSIEVVFRVFVFTADSDYEKMYEVISLPDLQIPYSSAPYLNYINTPGFRDRKENVEINSMGIRYPREISLQKPDSTFRILFMGGSTTFGDVDDTFDVFPALIETSLRDSVSYFNARFKNIECLNGGVHGLTSAELLTHFQFKYQYLQSDLIVIHTGFNDAFMYAPLNAAIYQPDYHNVRRVFKDITDLSPLERIFMPSKAFAYFIIHTQLNDFLSTTLEDNVFFRYTNNKNWFVPGNSAIGDTTYNAFYNNLNTLVSVATKRGIKVLLVPEVCDSTKMPADLKVIMPRGLKTNRGYMEKIAAQNSLYFCPLPDKKFTPDLFLDNDGIHVNYIGEKLKAQYIGTYIKQILQQNYHEDLRP